MIVYIGPDGLLSKATEVSLLLTEESLAAIRQRADDGDDLAQLIISGIVPDNFDDDDLDGCTIEGNYDE